MTMLLRGRSRSVSPPDLIACPNCKPRIMIIESLKLTGPAMGGRMLRFSCPQCGAEQDQALDGKGSRNVGS
jgi:hypothetical protein